MINVKGIPTTKLIYAIFSNLHHLRADQAKSGQFDASIALIDFESAYKATNISDKQHQALELVYEQDMIQREAAAIMGVTQQAIQQHISIAVTKIAVTYDKGGKRRWK